MLVRYVLKHDSCHPSPDTTDNDIMLIKLSKPATLDEFVKPVDLPKSCAPPDSMCRVSGWGITMNQICTFTPDSDKLQCLNLPIISDRDCNNSYPGLITGSMFCAGYLEGGKDVCQVNHHHTQYMLAKQESHRDTTNTLLKVKPVV
uniref:trypsin n=1 Tax=Sinocyclocheilus rhinocerous TaxID=307959 RepID=A0A673IQL7_9TELE